MKKRSFKKLFRQVFTYESFDLIFGCCPDKSDRECDNCCALENARILIGRGGPIARLLRSVTIRRGEKILWANKIVENPYCWRKLTGPNAKPKNFLVTYRGEIALANPSLFFKLLENIYSHQWHMFTILTRRPKLLRKKMTPAIKYMRKMGIEVSKLRNLSIGTSVGVNKYRYRIDELRKFKGFNLELWCKPVLEYMHNLNLKGINSIRISKEKGKHKRKCKQVWIDDIGRSAIKQSVNVYYDK